MDRSGRPTAAIRCAVWNDLSRNCKGDRPVHLSCLSQGQKARGFAETGDSQAAFVELGAEGENGQRDKGNTLHRGLE